MGGVEEVINYGMRKSLLVVGVAVVCVGCSTTPTSLLQYALADIPKAPAPAHDLRVGVSWFNDDLPRKNPKPPFDVGSRTGQIQKGKIGGHIAIALTRHLQQANVFRETTFVGGAWKKKAQKFDAQLTGTVKLFYSFHEYLPADRVGNAAVMFSGVAGVIGGAMADQILIGLDRKYLSELVLEDVRLVESGTGKILWKGSISKKLEGTTSLQQSASDDNAPWKQALKLVVIELVEGLQYAKLEL